MPMHGNKSKSGREPGHVYQKIQLMAEILQTDADI
jgi:hypothetical protein